MRTLAVFLLLVTSGFGLWWHWEAWYPIWSAQCDLPDVVYFEGPDCVVAGAFFAADAKAEQWQVAWRYDPATGRPLPSGREKVPKSALARLTSCAVSPDGSRVVDYLRWQGTGILDARSRRVLFVVEEGVPGGPKPMPPLGGPPAAFSADGEYLAVGTRCALNVFRRRRPEWWWGVFCLWEFWLTAVLAGLFVWSVWRDRRALKGASLSPCQGERDRG